MEDLSEKEQIDAIRAWWSENGNFVIGGVVVGVLIIFGWNSWRSNVADTEIAASTLFEDVMEAAGRNNLDAAAGAAESLFGEYPGTPYADQARLAMARMYMDSGRDQDAADVLRPLADDASGSELALVGRLRLAKILLYQDKADEVVALIKDQPETAFSARFNEVLGDAYAALESWAEAEAAYIAAMNDNPAIPTVDVALIQLKLNDLPVPGEMAEAAEIAASDPAGTSSAEEPAAEPSAEDVQDEMPTADEPPAADAAANEPGES